MLLGERKVYLGETLLIDTESTSVPPQETDVPVYAHIDDQSYRQIFFDDFNGGDVDRNHWSTDYNAAKYQPIYTSGSDVFCENSICHIRTTEDMAVLGGTSWAAGVSGIQSAQFSTPSTPNRFRPFFGFISQEGYYELKAKIYSGGGTHVAWWMTGVDDTGATNPEIDIFEILGSDTTKWPMNFYADTNSVASAEAQDSIGIGFDLSNDYHVYGFLWENGIMKFYLDGDLINTWSDINTPHQPLMTWLTAYRCLEGSYWAGTHVDGLGDLELLVDYLKVYKKCESESNVQPTITGQEEITVSLAKGEYTVDPYSGRIAGLPVYTYINWSDGSRTEHWVRWKKLNDTIKDVLDNGGFCEWNGIVSELGIKVIATINVD